MDEYDDNHPDVIRAKAEAEARILEARSKLSPAAQQVYAIRDSISDLIGTIGCLIILGIIVLAFFAPKVLPAIFGGQ